MMWQIQNEPEYMLNLLCGLRKKADRNRILDQFRHLFISSRDRFFITDSVFRAGGDLDQLYAPITRILEHADNESQRVKAIRLIGKMISQFNEREQSPEIWDAVLFYEILRTSYAATCKSWCCTNSSCERFGQLIGNASRRLQTVAIENKDFRDLIRQHDRENSFFYCDPPYISTEKMYSNIGEFGSAEHQALHDLSLNMAGKCMISYNWCDYIERTYAEEKFHLFQMERPHNMKQIFEKGAMFPEVLICNYDPQPYITENNNYGQTCLI